MPNKFGVIECNDMKKKNVNKTHQSANQIKTSPWRTTTEKAKKETDARFHVCVCVQKSQ